MELKIKPLKWSAGLPVVMINKSTAEHLGLNMGDRVSIKTLSENPKKLSSIVDIVAKLVKPSEIGVSSEIKRNMGLKLNQKVEVTLAPVSKSTFFIKQKLDGKKLSKKQISNIIQEIVSNTLSEAEVSLFISAMYQRGLDFDETTYLIESIVESGNGLKLKKKKVVDKHSIGGIPGNRTTPIVVSICAAAGLTVPKTSSRAITSSAGTADVMETLARVDFKINEIKKIVQKTNACLVWGGGLDLVPADSKIIKVEKRLGIDPESQLLASIMAKKLAMGAKYIVIDIPYGKTAKVRKKKALRLKKKFEKLGKHFNKKLKVILIKSDGPTGLGVGPVLEMKDVLDILNPLRTGPKHLEEKSLLLSSKLLEMSGKAKSGKGMKLAKEILSSGRAYDKFKEIIKSQKGNMKKLSPAKYKKDFFSKSSGTIKEIDNKKTNSLARILGCPADKSAGIKFDFQVRDKVKKSDKVLTLYAESKYRLKHSVDFYKKNPLIKMK